MDIRIGAYGVIIDDHRILLAHWNDPTRGGWTLPGGGIEPGEDPADAARREIFEETGHHAELENLLGVDSFVVPAENRLTNPDTPLHIVRIVFQARISGGELRHEIGGSTDRAEWFDIDDVPRLKRLDLVDVGLGYVGR